MNEKFISEDISFTLEGNEVITFSSLPYIPSLIPTEDQLRKKIVGIKFGYSRSIGSLHDMNLLKRGFRIESDDGIIKRVPTEFKAIMQNGVVTLRYGTEIIPSDLYEIAKKVGVIGYCDYRNMIICATNKYSRIIYNSIEFIKPYEVSFKSDWNQLLISHI